MTEDDKTPPVSRTGSVNNVHFSKDTCYVSVPTNKEKKPKSKLIFLQRTTSITEKYQKKKNLIYNDDLVGAVAKGDIEKCFDLLQKPNYQQLDKMDNDYSFHPIFHAAQKGHDEILKLLLDHNADINLRDDKGNSALHLAAQQRSENCCNLLLERGIDFNVIDKKYGNHPIHIATNEGLYKIVEWFLNKGVNPNIENKKRKTTVHLAACKGHKEILKLLLSNPSKPGKWTAKDLQHRLPLHDAAFFGHSQCCSVLIEASGTDAHSAHINALDREDKSTPLLLASKKGHARCCLVLGNPQNVNKTDARDNTALHYAAKTGFTKTINALLQFNPDVTIENKDRNKAIHIAAAYATDRHKECVQRLFEFGGNTDPGLNKLQQGLLSIAVYNGCTETIKFLLTKDLFLQQINENDIKGKTPLHLAIESQKTEEAKLLLMQEGIKCDVPDGNGNLPLHTAASKGLEDLVKDLLTGPRISGLNAKNHDGATPLHFAASNGAVQCCHILIQKTALIHSKDNDGFTPFHLAAREGQIQTLKTLLKAGNVIQMCEAVEISGDTPIHLAARNGKKDCVEYISSKIKSFALILSNEIGNTCLDEAFESKNDETFQLILTKWPKWNLIENNLNDRVFTFADNLHQFMHKAINENRRIVQNAIIESDWWFSGFSSDFCDEGICPNLRSLIENNPGAAEDVFDKCHKKQSAQSIYDFRLFEDRFYIPANILESPKIRTSAFDSSTGRLRTDCKFEDFSCEPPHALNIAIDFKRMNLLTHPLTKAYWRSKWKSYLSKVLYAMLMFEIVVVASMGFFLYNVWNWDKLYLEYNKTNSIFVNCSEKLPEKIDQSSQIGIYLFSLRIFMFLLAICIIVAEIHNFYKLRLRCLTPNFFVKISRLLGILIIITPLSFCSNTMFLVIETWQWQIGVVSMLITWYNLIQTLNDIPSCSVFMPITAKFIKSFFKVLFYILLILFIYVFIFYLLFNDNNKAFKTLWRSFIKSTVWILGDLAYDDMFLDDENPVLYPVMSNIIFLIFVTSISGFIINLIITQPAEHLDSFRNDAAYYKVSSRIQLMLKYDQVFDYLYMQKAMSHYDEPLNALATPSKNNVLKQMFSFQNLYYSPPREDIESISNEDLIKELVDSNRKIMTELEELKLIVGKLVKSK